MTNSHQQPRYNQPKNSQPKNLLHGITLEHMLTELVEHFGWEAMGQRIRIRCFTTDPSIASSLKFLRKTPWAREQVESLYGFLLRERARQQKRSLAAVVPPPAVVVSPPANSTSSRK